MSIYITEYLLSCLKIINSLGSTLLENSKKSLYNGNSSNTLSENVEDILKK